MIHIATHPPRGLVPPRPDWLPESQPSHDAGEPLQPHPAGSQPSGSPTIAQRAVTWRVCPGPAGPNALGAGVREVVPRQTRFFKLAPIPPILGFCCLICQSHISKALSPTLLSHGLGRHSCRCWRGRGGAGVKGVGLELLSRGQWNNYRPPFSLPLTFSLPLQKIWGPSTWSLYMVSL